MDSILQSIKKYVGIHESYTAFDEDITMHINTAFAILNQLGIGPSDGYMIEDDGDSWDDYITSVNFTMVKSFIYLSVKLSFDPPSNSALLESMKNTLNELTWRLELEGQNNSSN